MSDGNTTTTLSPEQLALLKVREMREAQKKYFQYRYAHVLQQAKELEAEVDRLLDQIVPKGQRKLF